MKRRDVLCSHCHRVLNWAYVDEFGQVCPDCLAALGEELPKEEPREPEPPVYRRKSRNVLIEDVPAEEA